MASPKEIRLTKAMKADVNELGYQQRTSMSALARQVIEDYAKGKPMPRTPEPPVDAVIKFDVDDETWEKARERAALEGKTLSEVGREGLERQLKLASRV